MGSPPGFGPVSYKIDSISDRFLNVPVVEQRFRFPRAVFVTGFVLSSYSGNPVEVSNTSIRIQDESFQDIITTGWTSQHEASAQMLSGLVTTAPLFTGLVQVRAYVLQRPVAAGDIWYFSASSGAVPVRIEAHLQFDEAYA